MRQAVVREYVTIDTFPACNIRISKLQSFIAKTPLQSRTSLATLTGVMCSTSQCELRSTFPTSRVTNVIRIVTYYTLPQLESPDSSWMTRSQRSRRRDKGLSRHLCKPPREYVLNGGKTNCRQAILNRLAVSNYTEYDMHCRQSWGSSVNALLSTSYAQGWKLTEITH